MHIFLQAEFVIHPIAADTLGCQVSDCSVISCSCDRKFWGILIPCLLVFHSHPLLPCGNRETFHLTCMSLSRSQHISERLPQDSLLEFSGKRRINYFFVLFFTCFNIKKAIYLFMYHQQKLSSDRFCTCFH